MVPAPAVATGAGPVRIVVAQSFQRHSPELETSSSFVDYCRCGDSATTSVPVSVNFFVALDDCCCCSCFGGG